jgi:hypothetical protein
LRCNSSSPEIPSSSMRVRSQAALSSGLNRELRFIPPAIRISYSGLAPFRSKP